MGLNNRQTVHIIGGAKTGYNLHTYLKEIGINEKLYYFPKEYSSNRNSGELFSKGWQKEIYNPHKKIILTSETALNNLDKEDRMRFQNHYFLREKTNITIISKEIIVEEIPILSPSSLEKHFPIIAKPKSSGSAPFKFKIIKNKAALKNIETHSKNCIFQQYFGPLEYRQIAIAGYFVNDENSLISVEQLNQYPIGVSSHIRLIENKYDNLKKQIAQYLKSIDFTGFIEFEFKVNKKDGRVYLIDVNPRLWGWSYFYFSGIQNMEKVIFEDKTPILKVKKEWINLPRYILSFSQRRFTFPQSLSLSFEPM